jgi:hypothetical protein
LTSAHLDRHMGAPNKVALKIFSEVIATRP